jgi:ribosomal protein S15P/S13E
MTNYSELNVIELHRNRASLESSLDLGGIEAERDLAACDAAISEKVDGLYIVLKNAEAEIDHWKQEAKMVAQARRSAESTVTRIKSLLSYLKEAAPRVGKKLIGRNYSFTLIKKKELDVIITSDCNDWDAFQRLDYALEESITKTTVLRSCVGDTLSQTSQTTTKLIPNVQALRDAYTRHGPECLPEGVRIVQGYGIRTGRVAGSHHTDSSAFLREAGSTYLEGGSADESEDS